LPVWSIVESKDVVKTVAKAPGHIADEYEFWKAIVRASGPHGLRLMKGMHDEALAGTWKGFRSSRLSGQWRVVYRIEAHEVAVYVVRVTPHDYRR
jgi:addiction module RelE/StbE family toxin